ncbi:MAG: hypothetical protein P1U32_05295 [Legionellaceae bacterium]|nr:hypothetical protein [Legionellaceae bacterium]
MSEKTCLTAIYFERALSTDLLPMPEAGPGNKVLVSAIQKSNDALMRTQTIAQGSYPALLKGLDTFEAHLNEIADTASLEKLTELRLRLDKVVRAYIKNGDHAAYVKAIEAEDALMTQLLSSHQGVLLYFKMWLFEALDATKHFLTGFLVLPALLVVPGFLAYDVIHEWWTPEKPSEALNIEKASAMQAMCEAAFKEFMLTGDEESYERTIQILVGTELADDSKATCHWFQSLRLMQYEGNKAKFFVGVLDCAITTLKASIQGLARAFASPVTAAYQAHGFFSQKKEDVGKTWDAVKKGPTPAE